MYDAIIVGARCGGSPLAMLLARKGYRVLLVDRAAFPSDTLSTHVVKIPGAARLKRWGVLDAVADSNCPAIRRIRFDAGPFALVGSAPSLDGVDADYAPRRRILDTLLLDAAAAAGAEVRQDFTVEDLVFDGDRVAGIRGRTRVRPPITEHASVVVGADGLRSLVARVVDAPAYREHAARTCAYYSYWSDVPVEGAEICPREGRCTIAFPTNDGLTGLLVEWPHAQFHEFRSDIEGNFLKTVDLVPGLADRVRAGRRVERFYGSSDLPHQLRHPYGRGWALIGDAGSHRDPITGEGISNAFRDADLLAEALDAGFSGRMTLDEALAGFHRERDEAMIPMYDLTAQLATLSMPPPMQQLVGALQGNQAEINRFLGAIVGTVRVQDFFAPESVGRILAAAGMAPPDPPAR